MVSVDMEQSMVLIVAPSHNQWMDVWHRASTDDLHSHHCFELTEYCLIPSALSTQQKPPQDSHRT